MAQARWECLGWEKEVGRPPPLCEAECTVEEDGAHPVHVRLHGEPVPAIVVRPLFSLSLDHLDELLTMPTFTGSERVDRQWLPF